MRRTSERLSIGQELAESLEPFRISDRRNFDPPMTIGVIADTHIFDGGARKLPPEVLDLFSRFGCGLIIHAGDANVVSVLQRLSEIAPVIAVSGNNDDLAVRATAPDELAFNVGRFRFGVVHGHGGASARSEAKRRFSGRSDLVVYGHSHIPMSERDGDTVYFNPGSATDRRWHETFGVGLIHIESERVLPELVLYLDPRDLRNVKSD